MIAQIALDLAHGFALVLLGWLSASTLALGIGLLRGAASSGPEGLAPDGPWECGSPSGARIAIDRRGGRWIERGSPVA